MNSRNSIKIYTAGKMSGLSYTEQTAWRIDFEEALLSKASCKVTIVNPPMYYNYLSQNHNSEAEVKEWDLNQVRDSDIVVVNLQGIESSIGTHFELGFINAINSFGGKHIYVVGIGNPKKLHPWIDLSMFRCEPDVESAADYIANYLLV